MSAKGTTWVMLEETKIKISNSLKGRKNKPCSKKTKQKISIANKGKKRSQEVRKQISYNLSQRIVSEETKKKISIANKGRVFTKEWKKKISDANKIALKGKKVSIETRKKMSEMRKGKKSHFWKNGITKQNTIVRQSLDYRLWREKIFKRDDFTCQKYGVVGCKLNAHHINNFAEFPELRFIIDNGITLSKKAHKEFHKQYGKTKNTKKQLLEFLNN